jgi:nucleoside recognition membrane protein YjiH
VTGFFGIFSFTTYAPDTIAGGFSIHYMIGLICTTLAFIGMLLAHTIKPKFIMDNALLKSVLVSSPVYFVSKCIGFIVIWMIFLNVGPAAVIGSFTGDVMVGLFASLVVIFLVLVPGIPLLTDFGLMEFIGVYIKKFVRVLFTLPGRASIDLIASWFGSSAASIIITREQHEKGFYTGRESAVASTNFAIVSVPFTFVVARTAGLAEHFFLFYFIMAVAVIFLAILMPRIWPLRNIPDTYLEDVGKQIEEEVPSNISLFEYATKSACARAQKTTGKNIIDNAMSSYAKIFLDLLPTLLAWGTLALMLVELTPFFDIVAWPMGWLLHIMQVEAAFDFSSATLVGFVDMFIPALLIGDAPLQTRMILGILSVVQVIYLAETGLLILKSRIPLNFGKLFILFMMRTIISLPIIVLLVKVLM